MTKSTPRLCGRTSQIEWSTVTNGSSTFVIVTIKRGKPVARLVLLEEAKPRSLYGFFSGHVVEESDSVSATGEAWGAEHK